jgi:hypothetical protein
MTQIDSVGSHLLAGKSITPGQALIVYGISRLAVAIDALRKQGFDINMVLKQDEAGKRYGEYKLHAPIVDGCSVQVRRGQGWGLPDWVLKTSVARCLYVIKDVAYVHFQKAGGFSLVQPMNVKELSHVG